MALELPGYAIPAFDLLSLPWPGIDEDELQKWATGVRTFAEDMKDTSERVRQAAADLADSSRSSFTSALSTHCEQQSRLVASLQDSLNDFANALDNVVPDIVGNKQVVIDEATTLAGEVSARKSSSSAKPSVIAAARAQDISQASQTVNYALEHLESVLGDLVSTAVPQVKGQLDNFLANLRDESLPAPGEATSLRLSYETLDETARTIRGQATESASRGQSSYAANANRDLSDHGAGGDAAGQGGRWLAVFGSTEQALHEVAGILFTSTSGAIAQNQRDAATALGAFADRVRSADERSGADDDKHRTARPTESTLRFKIQERAGEKAGKELSKRLQKELSVGDVNVSAYLKINATAFFAQLNEHENEPGWQTGVMRELSPTELQVLVNNIPGKGETYEANRQALAQAVAAAMAHGVNFLLPDVMGNEPDLSYLAPLVQYANFPPKVLAALGQQVMIGQNGVATQEVWSALAKDPAAAALFVQENASEIPYMVTASPMMGGIAPDQVNLFIAVLKAGTIGTIGPNGTSEHPQGGVQAVTALIRAYQAQPDEHAPAAFEAVYGDIIAGYWPDVSYAIGSQVQGARAPDGMTLTAQDWGSFIDEAMRNPSTAGMLLGLARLQSKKWISTAAKSDTAAGYGYEYQAGLVSGFFDLQASETYRSLGNSSSWLGALQVVADGAGLAVDLAVDPGSAVTTIIQDVGNDAINSAVSSFTSALGNGNSAKAPNYAGFQSGNIDNAVQAYEQATPQQIETDPGLAALYNSAKEYGIDKFIVKIEHNEKLSVAEQQAYNEWLSSPAVLGYGYAISDNPASSGVMDHGLDYAWQQGYEAYIVGSTVTAPPPP